MAVGNGKWTAISHVKVVLFSFPPTPAPSLHELCCSIILSPSFFLCSWWSIIIIPAATRGLCHLNVNIRSFTYCFLALSDTTDSVVVLGRTVWNIRINSGGKDCAAGLVWDVSMDILIHFDPFFYHDSNPSWWKVPFSAKEQEANSGSKYFILWVMF